jgi:NhaP-type Na+/H+ or K+/H+ antiporter
LDEHLLTNLALVIILGISSQWVAWRIKLPSILLLLVVGLVTGPLLGIIDTNELLGDLLFPIVSLSVAVILFEGGLSLRWEDVRETHRTVRNLITIGALITWLTSSFAAHTILNLDTELSLLLGATLVVTGPTVVTPLLNQIRPSPRVGSVLRWEGIMIDPVGAILAVLIFEEILAGDANPGFTQAITSLVNTILIGGVIGAVTGRTLIIMFSRYWIPDQLQNPVTLMAVVGAFTISNLLQPEAGLLTVTVMGMVMTNQKRVDLEHIIAFKEALQILLISALFILLAARIDPVDLKELGTGGVLFVVALVLIIRPLSVWISTLRSPLSWQERVFISWMAPRGIVAASVASIFSLELVEHGHPGAEILVPITFSVIISTVILYGLTAGFVARKLGLVQENPQGVLIIGAHNWVRKIALQLQKAGFRVLMLDTNNTNVEQALSDGLEAIHASAVSTLESEDNLGLNGIGRLLAMTPNDAINALANLHYKNTFHEVYQLPRRDYTQQNIPQHIGGNYLFGEEITFDELTIAYNKGAKIKAIRINNVQEYETRCWECIIPMFIITEDGQLVVWTSLNPPKIKIGQTVIGMVDPNDEAIRQTQEMVAIETLKPIVRANMKFADEYD